MRPVLFRIPFINPLELKLIWLPIYSYGVMLCLSLVIGWHIVLGLGERDRMDREKLGSLYFTTAVWSVIGARLLYVLTNLDRFDSVLDVFKVWQGGLVAYGGFLGGFLTGLIVCPLRGVKLLAWADCVVPSLGTGLAFTRIGCFLFGCDFGKPASVAWAVRFPKNSPAWAEQLHQGLIRATDLQSLPVHPTQLYEVAIGLALFGLTMLVRRFRTFSGQTFIAFTAGYGVLRFLVETLRADSERGEIGPLSTSQAIGIGTLVASVILYLVLRAKSKRDPAALRYWEATPAAAPPPKRHKKR